MPRAKHRHAAMHHCPHRACRAYARLLPNAVDRTGLQHRPYCLAKQRFSALRTGRFAAENGPFCNALDAKQLHRSPQAA